MDKWANEGTIPLICKCMGLPGPPPRQPATPASKHDAPPRKLLQLFVFVLAGAIINIAVAHPSLFRGRAGDGQVG